MSWSNAIYFKLEQNSRLKSRNESKHPSMKMIQCERMIARDNQGARYHWQVARAILRKLPRARMRWAILSTYRYRRQHTRIFCPLSEALLHPCTVTLYRLRHETNVRTWPRADTIFTTRFRKSAKRSGSAECYNRFTTNRPSEVCLHRCAILPRMRE